MPNEHRDLLRFLTAGSVDDGKPTRIGGLLYETGGVHDDQIASVRKISTTKGEQIDGRGDMSVMPDNVPAVTKQITANLIWMSSSPLLLNAPYLVKHTTQTLCGSITRLEHKLDVTTFSRIPAATLEMNEIGLVLLEMHKPIFADTYIANCTTGSFIIIDPTTNDTIAAGTVVDTKPESDKKPTLNADHEESNFTNRGLTVWLTGLSGAGKSTLARAVHTELLARGLRVEVLDAGVVRKVLNRGLGFTKGDRDENARRIGFMASLLTRQGVIVLVAAISPYRETRNEIRKAIEAFLEVHVNAPLSVCEERDPIGLYKKARAGEIRGFTGIDDPYEEPIAPELRCNTHTETVRESTSKIVKLVLDSFGEKKTI